MRVTPFYADPKAAISATQAELPTLVGITMTSA